MTTRQEMWERLGGAVDLLVIGGGINGAGIARDAARRGLRVAMVEMRDLASGTSSASSKLVHGGIRYLEQLEFSLVFEAVSERRILMDIAPHMVNPLGFLFPVYKGARRALTTINAGMWLYEGLSLFRSPKRHRTLSVKEIAEEEPLLKRDDLKGAPLYYDCATDDARLTLENALDAAQAGAVIATYAKVVELLRAPDSSRVIGAIIEDTLSGQRKQVRASVIINATGPWTDSILKLSSPERVQSELIRPTKGVHIVVDRQRLPVNHAVVCFHPEDGRVLFAIPWGDRTYLGTTDTDYQGDPAQAAADSEDVDYLIEVSNMYFPSHPIERADVISTWAGLRPLIRPVTKGQVDESAVSREHQILVSPEDGLITIAGGKLTTYRRMSQEVVDVAVKVLRLSNKLPTSPLFDPHTDRSPLPGAQGWPADDDHDRVARQILEVSGESVGPKTARLLADTYGMRGVEIARQARHDASAAKPLIEGRPEIMAQVDWAVREELAATVTDVMERRTQLFYRAWDQGLAASLQVGHRMQQRLGWTDAQRERHVADYAQVVARSRAWKDAAPAADEDKP